VIPRENDYNMDRPLSIKETSFTCPHCGALAQQFWYKVHSQLLGKDRKTPNRWTAEEIDSFENSRDDKIPAEVRRELADVMRRVLAGEVFTEQDETSYSERLVENLHLTRCYNCNRLAVWIGDAIAYPPTRSGPPPNEDMPADVRGDFEEARSVLALSPRGAAALLRLAIQKLCVHLGEAGKNLNGDIGNLVKKGLDVKVQRSLDIVRVIGNNAVHPGQIDLRDDRDTADKLLSLVNLITDIMITQPKHVEAMYETIPESQRKQIEERDGGE
jgi:hypothetical protein